VQTSSKRVKIIGPDISNLVIHVGEEVEKLLVAVWTP
jgi:hypothetical protein